MRTFITKVKAKMFHVGQYLIEEWLYTYLVFVPDVFSLFPYMFSHAHKKASNGNLVLKTSVLFHKTYCETILSDLFGVALLSASSPLSSFIILMLFDF